MYLSLYRHTYESYAYVSYVGYLCRGRRAVCMSVCHGKKKKIYVCATCYRATASYSYSISMRIAVLFLLTRWLLVCITFKL